MKYRHCAVASLLAITLPLCAHALTPQEAADADAYLARYHRNVRIVKRAANAGGEIISCVDVRRQPAMNHPLAKGGIQTEPSAQLKALLDGPVVAAPLSKICPTDSVEMRLPDRAQIDRAGGLKNLLSKSGDGRGQAPVANGATASRFAGHWYASAGAPHYATAAQTTINVWAPKVPVANDFSLSQMWVIGEGNGTLQTVEAGVQVSSAIYRNNNANFFIFWTANNYDGSGCYNHLCPAFVQVSDVLPIGGPVPSSTIDGTQISGTIAWYRDPATGHWWLLLKNADGSYSLSGYYPVWLFGSGQLSRHATRLEFGGEVYQDDKVGKLIVPMGSGNHPRNTSQLVGRVAYQRNIMWADLAGVVSDVMPWWYAQEPEVTGCYYQPNMFAGGRVFAPGWGTTIFFGGSGYPGVC